MKRYDHRHYQEIASRLSEQSAVKCVAAIAEILDGPIWDAATNVDIANAFIQAYSAQSPQTDEVQS